MKISLTILFILSSLFLKGQVSELNEINSKKTIYSTNKTMAAPTNDNCANAIVLTIGDALLCNQTTDQSTLEGTECYTNYGGGSSENTIWYRFTSSNDSLILNFIKTNSTNCVSPHIAIYGPFSTGSGCLPCGSIIYNVLQNGDLGSHILLTGLATSGNRDYLIQIQGNECGGGNDRFTNFCINITNPATNISSNIPSIINQCGVTFNGTTNGGYWATGTSAGFNNLDNNNGTTVGGASETGDDVTFVINNISWFKFCSVNAGTYNVQFDVITCALSGANSGAQMAILTGTSSSLTNIWQAANPTYTSTAVQTSPNFNISAGGCAFLVVDGFTGDACSYSYVLTNVSGGCILPVELISFFGEQKNTYNQINWSTITENNNNFFILEKSYDAINFEEITKINGFGNSNNIKKYIYKDYSLIEGLSYYRLSQMDYDGHREYFNIIVINNSKKQKTIVKTTNLIGQEVSYDFDGLKFIFYSDGTVEKY